MTLNSGVNLSLGICLTTNNPTCSFKTFLPSIPNLSELRPYAKFLINFQPPWTNAQIEEMVSGINAAGFDVKWQFTEGWLKPILFTAMRDVCASLDPGLDVYMLCDDDFRFVSGTPKFPVTNGHRYLQMLHYMSKYPKCGVVNAKGFFGGYHQQYKISPTWNDMYSTNRGTMLRSMREHGFSLHAPDCIEMRGALEESMSVFNRIQLGYFPAKAMNIPTVHTTRVLKVSDGDLDPYDMHHPDVIAENAQKYIREKYSDETWEYEQKRLPRGLDDLYKSSDGPDMKEVSENCIETYDLE